LSILVILSTSISLIIILWLCIPKTKRKTNIWYAVFLASASLGYPVAVFRDAIIPVTQQKTMILIAYFLVAMSYRFSPYFLLMAGLSYSNFIKNPWKNIIIYFTLIPCLATLILDYIFLAGGFLSVQIFHSSLFWTVSIWALPYGILGILFFIYAYFAELNSKRKKFKLFVSLINLPVLGNIFIAYAATSLKINGRNMWLISLIPAVALIYVWIFFAYKHGIFGDESNCEPMDVSGEEIRELLAVLTEAEKEVALLKLQGKTNQAIADLRHVSLATVKSQINDIHKKLHIKNIKELKHKQ
jgi:DNA-binding CsgD family transcriptional regulator